MTIIIQWADFAAVTTVGDRASHVFSAMGEKKMGGNRKSSLRPEGSQSGRLCGSNRTMHHRTPVACDRRHNWGFFRLLRAQRGGLEVPIILVAATFANLKSENYSRFNILLVWYPKACRIDVECYCSAK